MVIFVNKYHSDEPVNVVTSHGDCTPMIDKMIQSFAKRSRNTKSEASNDSPLSGLFILPIAHVNNVQVLTSFEMTYDPKQFYQTALFHMYYCISAESPGGAACCKRELIWLQKDPATLVLPSAQPQIFVVWWHHARQIFLEVGGSNIFLLEKDRLPKTPRHQK